jgi:uncharacterized membrane-anchored protein
MRDKGLQVAPLFWLLTVCSTTLGEAGADLLRSAVGLGLAGATLLALVLLAGALVAQLAVRRSIPAVHWAAVVAVGAAGTLCADDLVDGLGVPVGAVAVLLGLGLATVLAVWFRAERTLSVRSVVTRRRELFLWLAVLLVLAFGTATADWAAQGTGLGSLPAAAVFAGAIGVVADARFGFRASGVASFWAAYVLIRPLGVSLGDLFAGPRQDGGLGLGAALVAEASLLVLVGGVLVLTVQQKLAARRVVLDAVVGAVVGA